MENAAFEAGKCDFRVEIGLLKRKNGFSMWKLHFLKRENGISGWKMRFLKPEMVFPCGNCIFETGTGFFHAEIAFCLLHKKERGCIFDAPSF